jgi:L-threonylcarbamoyladenylate synthase
MAAEGSLRPPRVLDPSPAAIGAAAALLRAGALVAFPTETVYGLGADATDEDAVRRVFEAKARPATDPLIVHVDSFAQAEACGALDVGRGDGRRLAEQFWPGPLTLVVPRRAGVTDAVGGGLDTVGLRMPAHPVALELIRETGRPLAAPSANRFGRVSPTRAQHVVDELRGSVALVLDAGPTPLGVESTVVLLGDDPPRVVRPGGVTVEDLREVVADTQLHERLVSSGGHPAPAPGGRIAHYSPAIPVTLVEATEEVTAELAEGLRSRGTKVVVIGLTRDPATAAATLYDELRGLDATDAEMALATALSGEGLGRAVNDRLFRAAHGHVVTECTEGELARLADRAGAAVGVQAASRRSGPERFPPDGGFPDRCAEP